MHFRLRLAALSVRRAIAALAIFSVIIGSVACLWLNLPSFASPSPARTMHERLLSHGAYPDLYQKVSRGLEGIANRANEMAKARWVIDSSSAPFNSRPAVAITQLLEASETYSRATRQACFAVVLQGACHIVLCDTSANRDGDSVLLMDSSGQLLELSDWSQLPKGAQLVALTPETSSAPPAQARSVWCQPYAFLCCKQGSSTAMGSISVRNPTDRTIAVESRGVTCSCLKTTFSRCLLAPGESASVGLQLELAHRAFTLQELVLSSSGDDGADEILERIPVLGLSEQGFSLSSREIDFGSTKIGAASSRFLTVSAPAGRIREVAASFTDANLIAKVEKMDDSGSQFRIVMSLSVSDNTESAPAENNTEMILTAHSADGVSRSREARVPVRYTILPALRLTPKTLLMNSNDAKTNKVVVASTRGPIEQLSVESAESWLLHAEKRLSGDTWEIEVRLASSQSIDASVATLQILAQVGGRRYRVACPIQLTKSPLRPISID